MLSQSEIREIRKDFPYLSENPQYIYIDNAATTQKPKQVLEALSRYYENSNGNPHRSAHKFANLATEVYEDARKRTALFINASPEEIIFVRNASEGINLAAYSWGLSNLKEGDEILFSVMEHHSNLVPWQFVAKKTGAKLSTLFLNEERQITNEEFLSKVNGNTKLLAISAASNVISTMPELNFLIKAARKISPNIVVMVDATQLAPHHKIDVKEMDCDFSVFSGHKMLSAMGIGVLYGKKALLDKMPPFLYGGEMIDRVTLEGSTFSETPAKFEAGTVNVGGATSLKTAMDYLEGIGLDRIFEYETHLMDIAYEGISKIRGIEVYSSKKSPRTPVLAFNFKEVHPHDVATILDSEGVAIRSGHHCCEPLHKFLNLTASCRASFSFYNTEDEISRFLEKLEVVKKVMKIGNE